MAMCCEVTAYLLDCLVADFSLDDPYNVTQLKTAILVHGEKDRSTSNLVVQRVPKYSALLGPHKCHVVPSNLSTFFDNENENVEQLIKILGRARKRRASIGPQAGAVAEGAIPESSKKRVIIVHNHIESAQRLVEACRQQSVEAILLKVGDLKWYVYCKEIETCLVLLTPEFMRSSWCEGQLTFATGRSVTLLHNFLSTVLSCSCLISDCFTLAVSRVLCLSVSHFHIVRICSTATRIAVHSPPPFPLCVSESWTCGYLVEDVVRYAKSCHSNCDG